MKNTFPNNQLKYERITNVDEKRAFLKTAIDAIGIILKPQSLHRRRHRVGRWVKCTHLKFDFPIGNRLELTRNLTFYIQFHPPRLPCTHLKNSRSNAYEYSNHGYKNYYGWSKVNAKCTVYLWYWSNCKTCFPMRFKRKLIWGKKKLKNSKSMLDFTRCMTIQRSIVVFDIFASYQFPQECIGKHALSVLIRRIIHCVLLWDEAFPFKFHRGPKKNLRLE